MREIMCVMLLSAVLTLQMPAPSPTPALVRPAIVRLYEPDDPPLLRRRRQRNHYRGW